MDDFTPFAFFTAIVYSLTEFLDRLSARFIGTPIEGAGKQVTSWAAGVLVSLLASATNFAQGIPTFAGESLATASITDIVFIGLGIAAGANVTASIRNAVQPAGTKTGE